MAAVAAAAEAGTLRVDDELHLTPLAAEEEEDPQVAKLRAALDRRIGEAQLPELILAVDAEVRFSLIMLGREPRSTAIGLRGIAKCQREPFKTVGCRGTPAVFWRSTRRK
jgi:hypothetical protein